VAERGTDSIVTYTVGNAADRRRCPAHLRLGGGRRGLAGRDRFLEVVSHAAWMIWRAARQQEAAARRRPYREYGRGVTAISCASATPPGAARHCETTSRHRPLGRCQARRWVGGLVLAGKGSDPIRGQTPGRGRT